MGDSYRVAQVLFNNHPTPQQQYYHDTIFSPQYLQSVAEEQTITAREDFHPSEANQYEDQYYYAPLYDTKYDMQTISITEYHSTFLPDLDQSTELSIPTSQHLNKQFIQHPDVPSSACDYSINQTSNNCNAWLSKVESPYSDETHPTVSQESRIDIMRMEHYRKLLAYYQTLEEEKRRELHTIQAIIKQLKEQITSYQSYLDDKYFINKHTKKLHPMSYEALFNSFIQQEKTRNLYYREQHPKVKNITDLIGVIYFVHVRNSTSRSPWVGHPFRCYSGGHYSSLNREHPIICKTKEWPSENPTYCWRLYHYYSGKPQ